MFRKLMTGTLDRLEGYCQHPAKVIAFFAAFLTIFYTLQCSLLQNVLGLDVLEAFSWGAQGALGHAKHPPLSGWLAYGISAAGNHQDWVLYFAAQLCLAIGVVFVYRTARLFLGQYAAATAALLCYFFFYFNPSETRFCTYPVEMMRVPVASYNFFRALRENKLLNWVMLGIFCAAGLLNKYSFGLVMFAFVIIFLRSRDNWKYLKSVKPYLTILVMAALLAPHLKWLYENDFICFRHVSGRLSDDHRWYTPLVVFGTAVYPYAMAAVVLLLALLPDFRKREAEEPVRQSATDTLLIAAVPAATLVLLSFAGNIISMWFCSMAAMAAVAVVSFFPYRIGRRFFTRVVGMLILFCIVMTTATSLDLLCKVRPRIHSDPACYTSAALEFYKRHSSNPIPVVIGSRFEATLLEKYLPHHPPACELGDEIYMQRYHSRIRKEGALVIVSGGKGVKLLKQFQEEMQIKDLPLHKVTYSYKALWAKERTRSFFLAYIKPLQ